ncbi:outer dense fiber protein 2-like isoform X2 [Vanessa cardui]|uniref:outer dense fiber protein 2-like isoform X2 n=1 Tax=Vanessa cardui TaxID=171605 RepID=UPI001F145D43|nr:outer dense fiber protein 2-like isoform X2 [Vanessa cardui]
MTPSKIQRKSRSCLRESPKSCTSIDQTDISPKLNVLPKLWGTLKKVDYQMRVLSKSPRERITASESNLPFNNSKITSENYRVEKDKSARGDDTVSDSDITQITSDSSIRCTKMTSNIKGQDCKKLQKIWKNDKSDKYCGNASKKSPELSQSPAEAEDSLTKQIRDIHTETRKSTRIIRDSRVRLTEIQKKENLTEADIKELGERNELLLREMERFDRLTKTIQKLVGDEVLQMRKSKEHCQPTSYIPSDVYDSSMYQEMKMNHPTVLLATRKNKIPGVGASELTRSKSEIDLTRKLSESYDMQEKLVADNADLEVKRYILYKELMTKDQNLETCRSQIKRLQGELKLMNNENALLHEKLNKNSPEENEKIPVKNVEDLLSKLNNYKSSTLELENQLGGLELEVRNIRVEMADVKAAAVSACRGGGARNTCFEQPAGGPPVPPMTRACGVCPPCPAPCNPNAPPTPAEREVQKLTIQLRQTEESLKTKVTECAMLRTDLLKKKEELEKERCQHREVQNKLRELEMKFEGLTTHTNMMMGTKEQAFEQEVNVRALKQCYREAREEIDELRTLMKEQNNQLQDYRVKYLQAQQLVEEQRRQMDLMDMDNTRISEQINLEIQRVKLKFQEKLQELAPIPDLLKATQMKLKDAQQSQAIAEHNAEQLARELNSAREKVHVLLHNSLKPPEKPPERSNDEKQMALLQQRISQLTETNLSLKSEIERLKANVIRMEESVLANEKRLHEKMHECAQLGGELDRARDEAARALQRANERTETLRKCMQTSIGELERQLASTRAQVKTAEKDREELQCRMQCQIKRLNENFEQAQLRILGLQTQVQTLRRTASSTGEGEGDADQMECACKSFFDNP